MKMIRTFLTIGISLAASSTALAEQVTGPALQPGAGDGNDIVVTARRREERLQDTPVAVTALNAEALKQKAVVNVADIGRLAPNLTIASGRGEQSQSFIFIRGIGQGDDNPSVDPGVAIYVDDVYLGRSQGSLFNLNDAAQVEVLRGPQGTLYGKNTIGGAIKVTSHIPGPDPEYVASIGYGNYNETRLFLAVSHPLVEDKLFVRLSGQLRRRDGVMSNDYSGQKFNNISTMSGRLMVHYVPSDSVDALLSIDASDDNSRSTGGRLTALATPPTPLLNLINTTYGSLAPYVLRSGANPYAGSNYDVSSDPTLRKSPFSHAFGASLRLGWTGNDIEAKSITAYRRLHDQRVIDIDASPLRLVQTADELRQHQFSQELQLGGQFGTIVNYLGGLYYFDESVGYRSLTDLAPATSSDRNAQLETKSYAAYLNVTFKPFDGFSATLGGRYTHEKRAIDTLTTRLGLPTVIFGPAHRSASFNDFAPKIEVDYKFTPDIFAYLSAAKGFKSGGFNGRAGIGAALDPFAPERAWTYEAGLKTQFIDRRLTLNLTGYHTDYKGLQEQVYAATAAGGLAQVVTNAASAKIDGVEVEANARLGRMLTLFGNGGYSKARYKSFTDALLGDLSALKLPYTPRWTYMVGAQIKTPLTDDVGGEINVDYSWHSSTFTDVPNTVAIKQPAFGMLNARAAISFGNGVEVGVYGKNLTDKRVVQSGYSFLTSFGFAGAFFTDPRTFGVEANWHF